MTNTNEYLDLADIGSININTPQRQILEVNNVGKRYGSGPFIIENLDFSIGAGEVVCLVGPSGVGKTTLLKSLAGLHRVSTGEVVVNGRAITKSPKEMALVFQDYSRSLMPWLTVEKNVEFPLKGNSLSKTEISERIKSSLEEVGLTDAGKKYPWELSGGMQQRVAIARALAYKPDILIMDEPFASVDAQTRFELEDLTLKIRKDLGVTILLVTHDIDEAVYLADRILVLGGRPAAIVEEIDVPLGSQRDQVETRGTKPYAQLRTKVMKLIRDVSESVKKAS